MTSTEIFYQAETEILQQIARLLSRGSIASADWQISKLMQMATLNAQALKIVKKYRDQIANATDKEIRQTAARMIDDIDAVTGEVRPIPAISPQLKRTIETWAKLAVDQMNITMSSLAGNAGAVYSDIIAQSTLSVLQGSESKHQAMVKAIKKWSEQGVPNFIDKAGRRWSSEATAGMVIRTNQRKVANQVMLDRAGDYGTDLLEISSHSGSRPEHQKYQGKIYSISGNTKGYTSESGEWVEVGSLKTDTSYGKVDGILTGVNCKHVGYPFFPGISIQRFQPTSEATNDKQYAASQEQRRLEVIIRKAKRELLVMQELGDENGIRQAKQLVRDRQANMREFIASSGRTRRNPREQIYSKE